MKNISLKLPFLLALTALLFGTIFFPTIRLLAFAPFFALLYAKKSFAFSLWISALCGLIVDLLSSEMRFGLHAMTYSLTTFFLYHQKRNFFEENAGALSLFTALLSFIATGIQLLIISALDKPLALSLKFIMADLVGMPLLDAVYAFLWFTCPLRLYSYLKAMRWRKGN